MKGRQLSSNVSPGTTRPSSCRWPASRWVWWTEWCCSTCPSTPWTPALTTWTVSPPLRTPWWCSGGRVCKKVNLFNWTDWTTTARSYPSRYGSVPPVLSPQTILVFSAGPGGPGPSNNVSILLKWSRTIKDVSTLQPDQTRPVSTTSQQVNTSSYLSSVCLHFSVCLDHSPFIWFILTYGCVYVNLSLSDFHFSSGREK